MNKIKNKLLHLFKANHCFFIIFNKINQMNQIKIFPKFYFRSQINYQFFQNISIKYFL